MNLINQLPPKDATIAVGISGGVDSSVSAYLLKQAGYRVFGIFMKNWEEGFNTGYCTVAEDLEDARDVCDTLEIELHVVDFVEAYHQRVFQHFLAEYAAGRTPNPDVLCNREIKFAELAHHAWQLGAQYLATGHYAQRGEWQGQPALLKGADGSKDQTYFLSQITPAQLQSACFPLGHLQKSEVRRIAQEQGLITFDKKDSTGICFIGERPFREFLQHYFAPQKGKMQTLSGKVLGEHQGLMFYTIGQRQGLGIGGVAGASEEPWYVVEKDLKNNILYVEQGEHEALYHRVLRLEQCAWLNGTPPLNEALQGKTRYRQADQSCRLLARQEALYAVFDAPQRAITLGQYAVFYDGERCLGSGVIAARYKNEEALPLAPSCLV